MRADENVQLLQLRGQREHHWDFWGNNTTQFIVLSVIIWKKKTGLRSLESTRHLFYKTKAAEASIKSQPQAESSQVFDVVKTRIFPNPHCIFQFPDCTATMCLIKHGRRAGETAQGSILAPVSKPASTALQWKCSVCSGCIWLFTFPGHTKHVWFVVSCLQCFTRYNCLPR